VEATAAVEAADLGLEDEEHSQRPTELLPMSQLARISAYWLGLTAIDSAIGITVQNRIQFERSLVPDPYFTGTANALVGLAGAVIAILVQPTIGFISDYTESRWGRRKPYIVIGSLLDVVFLMGIAYSNSLLALAAFIALLQVSTNTARGPFQGYVPDLVAGPQVATASALVGMMQIFGNITGTVIATFAVQQDSIPLGLAAIAAIEVGTMVSVVLRVGKGLPPKPRRGRSWLSIARGAWATDILRERSFVWLLVSRFMFLTAGGILFNLAVKYMAEVHSLNQDEANDVVRIVTVLIAVSILIVIVPSARLSDRIGRKPVIYIACAAGVLSMLFTGLGPVIEFAYVGALLWGVASGVFLAVDWALMTDIIPRSSAGRYMGISNVATGASTPVSVALGGVLADLVNRVAGIGVGMRVSLLFALGLYILAAIALRPVIEPIRRRHEAATAA
jgi:MFS family permease